MRTENALKYTIDTILTIALGYKIDFSIIDFSEKNIEIELKDKIIDFKICETGDFDKLLAGDLKLSQIPAFDNYYQIPVVKIDEKDNLFQKDNEKLTINVDLLSLSFILLSNLDEYISEAKGEHDRFVYSGSLSEKYNLVKIPVVDEYAMLLRQFIQQEWSFIEIKPREFSVTPTHDIDDIYRFTGTLKSIKSILGQLVLTKNIKEVILAVRFLLKRFSDKREDPYFKGIETLLKDSEVNGLKSVFFFMAAKPSGFDSGYDIYDKNLKEILNQIETAGMISGVHPGFYTYKDKEVLSAEIARVAGATGHTITHSRQHYLRFDRRQTFDNLQDSGIEIDYTMGFAEEEGFKCGTAHEFHPYDFKNDKPYKIKERPLIAMDVTLSSYKKYSVAEASQALKVLYDRIKRSGGDFIILWHNAYIYREVEFYKNVYLSFLNESGK